jgi:hypothetical protein
MTDRLPTRPAPSTPHTEHDLLLVAAHSAGDVEPADRPAAEALLAACPECADLAADLRAIAAATAQIPAPARPRDFTLRPQDAARLRPLGWRRVAAAFGARRLDVTRPLAIGLTTFGLVGLLVSGAPLLSFGGSTGAAPSAAGATAAAGPAAAASAPGGDDESATIEKAGVPSPAASAAAASPGPLRDGAGQPGPSASGDARNSGAFVGSAAPSGADTQLFGPVASLPSGRPAAAASAASGGDDSGDLLSTAQPAGSSGVPLAAVSALLLVLGLALFALRRAARNAGAR